MEPQPPINSIETTPKKSVWHKSMNFIYAALVVTIIAAGVTILIQRSIPWSSTILNSSSYGGTVIGHFTQTNSADPACTAPHTDETGGKATYYNEQGYRGIIRTGMPVQVLLSCDHSTFTVSGAVTQTISYSDTVDPSATGTDTAAQRFIRNHYMSSSELEVPDVFETAGDYNSDGYNDLVVWDGEDIRSEKVFLYDQAQKKFVLYSGKDLLLQGGYTLDSQQDIETYAHYPLTSYTLKKNGKTITKIDQPGLDGNFSVEADFKDFIAFAYHSRGSGNPLDLVLINKATGEDPLKDEIVDGVAVELLGVDQEHESILFMADPKESTVVVYNLETKEKTYFATPGPEGSNPRNKMIYDTLMNDIFDPSGISFSAKSIMVTSPDGITDTLLPLPQ